MPAHRKCGDEHEQIVQEHALKGLGARAIFKLKIQELSGFTEIAIQDFMSKHQLVDANRSLRIRTAARLTDEKKQELIEFLQGRGKQMPDHIVARKLRVSEQSVYWFRHKSIGRVEGGRRYDRATEQTRREKIRSTYLDKRKKRYEALCTFQSRLENENFAASLRQCTCCGARRFLIKEFFVPVSSEITGKIFWSGQCRQCIGDLSFLRRSGYSADQVKETISRLFGRRPAKTQMELKEYRKFLNGKYTGPVKTCRHCRFRWPHIWQFFHQVFVGRDRRLLDTCLACPAERKFFSK